MPKISSSVTSYLFGLLTSDAYVESFSDTAASAAAIAKPEVSIAVQNAAPELLGRAVQVHFPAIYVYCEKLNNTLKEKFASFSGTARLVVEIRCSQDRIEGLEQQLDRYVDTTCGVLDRSRGAWQDGAFYNGAYEVLYGPVRHGGKNFIQIAKVSFEVQVSR